MVPRVVYGEKLGSSTSNCGFNCYKDGKSYKIRFVQTEKWITTVTLKKAVKCSKQIDLKSKELPKMMEAADGVPK